MSHPIIEGPVQLLKILTPGAYWIKCSACECSDRFPTSLKHKPYPEYYYPHQGDKVFVVDDDGFFYRGTVCGRRKLGKSKFWKSVGNVPATGFWKYVVQLNDTFQVEDFDQQFVFPTYGESSASCPGAHLVCLYNVLPQMPPAAYGKCVKIHTNEHLTFEKTARNWDEYVSLISCAINKQSKFSFTQSKLINGCVYGELTTSAALTTGEGMSFYNLADYLHHERFAAIITFRFDDVVSALMTNHLVEYSDLLATFDPSGKTSCKPKPALVEPRPEPDVFSGFTVHPDDVALHRSLLNDKYCSVNVFFTGAPLRDDICLRYMRPDGNIILGTVMSIDVKYCQESDFTNVDKTLGKYSNSKSPVFYNIEEFIEQFYKNTNMPSDEEMDDDNSDEQIGNDCCHLSYNFGESLNNFTRAGCIFELQFLPYPCSSAVEEVVLQYLDGMGVEKLLDWQKLCLPSLCSRKNSLVLGTKSTGKLTTSVVSALACMSRDGDDNSIHPRLIIFFSDFDRADKTASLCSDLTDFRVIVSTSFIITTKQKELAQKSCDVLITTPSNWAQLVFHGVFNYSRLRYVIFDQCDRLDELYAEELVDILDSIEASSRRVQTTFLANNMGQFVFAFKKCITTLCIADVVLSCFYKSLEPIVLFFERGDWMRHIENILSTKRNKKCILLCKDFSEGKAIEEWLSSRTDLTFVHDALPSDNAYNRLKEWTGNKVLVCTDSCLERVDFPMEADVVIRRMTTNRTALSNSFLAFNRLQSFTTSLSSVSAYLLCDNANLDELLLVKSIAQNVTVTGDGSLEAYVKSASFKAELVKSTPICPSIYMFGDCRDAPTCPSRHVFRKNDDLESPSLTQFLKVHILKVHSAFRYAVRVTEVITNSDQRGTNNLNALNSKLDQINEGLVKSRMNACSCSLKVGDMVGASILRERQSIMRRVIVKRTPVDSSNYTVSVIDFEEPDLQLPLSKLFVIPHDVARHPKDVVDLYIAGLMPADSKSDWKHDSANFVLGVLNQITRRHFLAGKVDLVTADRSVLAESLNCLEDDPYQVVSIIDSDFCSLKDLLLKSGYCIENPSHLPSLSKLVHQSAVRSCFSVPSQPFRYSSQYLVLKSVVRFGFRTNLPTTPVMALVSSFDDPGLFYVQLIDERDELRYFEESLSEKLNHSKQNLRLIALDELCAVNCDGTWNRAMICNITGGMKNCLKSINITFVDHGDIQVGVHPDQLYCLPDAFAERPFFAIQCELVGIKPLQGDEWNTETVDKFKSYIQTRTNDMHNVLVEFHGPKSWEQKSTFFDTQKVVMWEPDQPDDSINFRLARGGFASFDSESKHHLMR